MLTLPKTNGSEYFQRPLPIAITIDNAIRQSCIAVYRHQVRGHSYTSNIDDILFWELLGLKRQITLVTKSEGIL